MEKKTYTTPEMEVEELEVLSEIVTSYDGPLPDNGKGGSVKGEDPWNSAA